MIKGTEALQSAPDTDQLHNPIPFTPEHVINSQVPLLDSILMDISQHLDFELEFAGTVDVLNIRDYPLAHSIATGFIRAQRSMHKQHFFPNHSWFGKPVLRELFTATEQRNGPEVVRATSKNPLCYRYMIEFQNKYLGDIFVIPVHTRKSTGQAIREHTGRLTFETLIIGVDQRSRKKRKVNPDLIAVDGYPDEDETEYFVLMTDEPLNGEELSSDIANQILSTLRTWWEEQTKRRKKR